jgi:hypothetical protein
VYRLIDALVVGEKNEADVQESVRRWWALIHPADRPVAQKYLLMVLGRSASALDAMGDAMLSTSSTEPLHSSLLHSQMATKRMRIIERVMKESSSRPTV